MLGVLLVSAGQLGGRPNHVHHPGWGFASQTATPGEVAPSRPWGPSGGVGWECHAGEPGANGRGHCTNVRDVMPFARSPTTLSGNVT